MNSKYTKIIGKGIAVLVFLVFMIVIFYFVFQNMKFYMNIYTGKKNPMGKNTTKNPIEDIQTTEYDAYKMHIKNTKPIENDIYIDVLPIPVYKKDFKYETIEIIRDNIEPFMITYLNLINTNRINTKLKEYLINKGDLTDIRMQTIFKLKKMDLDSFSEDIYSLINKMYFSNSKNIDNNKIKLYGLFLVIKLKFSKLNNNFYTFNYYIANLVLVPTQNKQFIINRENLNDESKYRNIREILNDPSNIRIINEKTKDASGNIVTKTRHISITNVDDINKCFDSEHRKNKFCLINGINFGDDLGRNNYALTNLYKKYEVIVNRINEEKKKMSKSTEPVLTLDAWNQIQIIKKELANNLYQMIILCELRIVRDLILAYNDALPTMKSYNVNNYKNIINTENFKKLQAEINKVKSNMKIYTPDLDKNLTMDTILEA